MREQLTALREAMRENGIGAWIVPTTDFHGSEYVNDYFKCREYLSGFTGSAGTLAVTPDAAALWTDGRYFLQAETQLAGSGITLMREGTAGVPTLVEWLQSHLPQADAAGQNGQKSGAAAAGQEESAHTARTVGFDGRIVDRKLGRQLEERFPLRWDLDLCGLVWPQRPPLTASKLYALPLEVTGESAASKLGRIRRAMQEQGADYHLITSLEEIAWIWNLRAQDVTHTPVFYAFLLLTPQETRVYLLNESEEAAELFRAALREGADGAAGALPDTVSNGDGNAAKCDHGGNLRILPYFYIFEDLKELPPGRLLLDESRVSYGMAASIPGRIEKLSGGDPGMLMKAIKNETEIAATRRAHVRDGAAMVRFLFRLKQRLQAVRAGSDEKGARAGSEANGLPAGAGYAKATAEEDANGAALTEMSAAAQLEEERRRAGAYDLSFDTIAGYGPHGAIVHYESKPETDVPLTPEGFLLVDSGGQYPDGTTDITRTIALGPLTEKMKHCYTAVLRSHIALATAVFDETTTGADLDQMTRGLLQAQGLDYLHGTGHGVGHLLSVHEGPNTISPRGKASHIVPGMITSNEPGVYLTGEFGIRLENEILCREQAAGAAERTEPHAADAHAAAPHAEKSAACGTGASRKRFFFETITFCPFEREAILTEELTDVERCWLNDYHRQVYETLAPLLETDVRDWLAEQTAPL